MVVPLGVVAALVELVCAGAIFALVEVMMRQAPALSASTTATSVTTAATATTSLGPLWATNVSVSLLSVVTVGLFVVKGVITSVVHHHQHGVTEQLRRDLMVRVLRQALSSPWLVHLERGPAAVHHDLTHNVDTVVDDVMAPAAQAGVNVLIMAALIVPLLLAAPIPTVTALLVMATWTLGLHRLTRGLAKRVGHTEQVARRRGQRVLAGALGALRELRALGRTEAVVAEYRDALEGRVRARQLRGTLSAQPRVWSESLVVIALAVAVGVGLADVTTFPVLGAGAYAAMRIMPLANGTVWLLWRMRSGSTALSSLSSLA